MKVNFDVTALCCACKQFTVLPESRFRDLQLRVLIEIWELIFKIFSLISVCLGFSGNITYTVAIFTRKPQPQLV